jgi:hypothetical protein
LPKKREFVADSLDQDLSPVSKKHKGDKELEPIGSDDAFNSGKSLQLKPSEHPLTKAVRKRLANTLYAAEKPKEKASREKDLAALLFPESDDEDEAEVSLAAVQARGPSDTEVSFDLKASIVYVYFLLNLEQEEEDEFGKHLAEQIAKVNNFFMDTPSKASGPQANEAEDQDSDIVVVDTSSLPLFQSVPATRKTSVTLSPVKTKPSDAAPKDTRRISPAKALGTPSPSKTNRHAPVTPEVDRKTASPSKVSHRVLVAEKSDLKTPSPSKVDRRTPVPQENNLKTPSPSKVEEGAPVAPASELKTPSPSKAKVVDRAPVAQMLGASSGENPLQDFKSQLLGKLGELLDLEQILKLSRPDQIETYLRLKTVFASAVRHLEKDIEWVFQKEQEQLDDY